jgi:hypothetical protein
MGIVTKLLGFFAMPAESRRTMGQRSFQIWRERFSASVQYPKFLENLKSMEGNKLG